MFPAGAFAPRYFAPHYWPKIGAAAAAAAHIVIVGAIRDRTPVVLAMDATPVVFARARSPLIIARLLDPTARDVGENVDTGSAFTMINDDDDLDFEMLPDFL